MRYVVPSAAGGLTDVIARLVNQQMRRALEVNVVIDNKSGGGVQTGAADVARSAADGGPASQRTAAIRPRCSLDRNVQSPRTGVPATYGHSVVAGFNSRPWFAAASTAAT
ncbi:MAG: hypothetical protein ABIN96_00200, partial [Rubrivivax sp.]